MDNELKLALAIGLFLLGYIAIKVYHIAKDAEDTKNLLIAMARDLDRWMYDQTR